MASVAVHCINKVQVIQVSPFLLLLPRFGLQDLLSVLQHALTCIKETWSFSELYFWNLFILKTLKMKI